MAYKILFFWKMVFMKEIGEKLKEARESIGISILEASEDLKVLPSQIESIEIGEMDKFKDVHAVKNFIHDYAKYLGLRYEDIVDEFNEYLFDYTSKLSLDDIKKAKQKDNKKEQRITSPYTLEPKKRYPIVPIIVAVLVIALIATVAFVINRNENKDDDQIIALVN